jgi:methyl-accepting chemotaxis protein
MMEFANAPVPAALPRRHPLGHSVVFGIAGFLGLLIAVAVMAIALVVNLNRQETNLNTGNAAFVTAVQSAALDAKAIANDQRGYLLSGDDKFLVEAQSRETAVRASFTSASIAAGSDPERRAVSRASDGFERWVTAFQSEVDTYKRGDQKGAIATSLGADRDLRKTYEASLDVAETIGVHGVQSGDHSVSAAATLTIRLLIAGLLVALVIGVGIGEWLLRTIVRPLHHLVDALYS